jgi:hypothetical protein
MVEDDGPYEVLPDHLYEALICWINSNLGGREGSSDDVLNGPRLAAAIRRISPRDNGPLTVRAVTESVSLFDTDDKLLDAVRCCPVSEGDVGGCPRAARRTSNAWRQFGRSVRMAGG